MTPAIRLAEESDAATLQAIYEPHVRESATSFEAEPPSVAEMRERVAKKAGRFPWLVCEVEDGVVGYAYAGALRGRDAYQWSVESSVYVDEAFRRHGVARGLYESLFAVLALQGFRNVYAGTKIPNPASVGFHRSMGFESIGVYERVGYKDGAWHDVQWWQRALGDHPDDPEPPRELDAIRDAGGWDAALEAGLSSIRL